jgi:hypothetical protein
VLVRDHEVNGVFDEDRGSWLDESSGKNRKTGAWLAPLGTMKSGAWLAAVNRLSQGHAGLCDKVVTIIIVQGEEDHPEGALMTGAVVTAADGT